LIKVLNGKVYEDSKKLDKIPKTNSYKDGLVGKKITLEQFI
jgi:hypothetical protein